MTVYLKMIKGYLTVSVIAFFGPRCVLLHLKFSFYLKRYMQILSETINSLDKCRTSIALVLITSDL